MLGVVLAGCSGPSPAPTLPDGVEVTLVQLRGDIAPGRVQLHIVNGSDTRIVVESASLSSRVLEGAASWESDRAETLAAGRTVNLPVTLPAVRCDDDGSAPTVTLAIEDADGIREVTAVLPDELGVLDALAQTECDREAVEAVAEVQALGLTRNADGSAAVRVSITPTGERDGEVTLVGVRGTPLLRFTSGAEWPLNLSVAARDEPLTTTVSVVPQRCDPHAIAEDKVGTRLTLVAEVDGVERVYPLPSVPTLKGDLLAFTASFCGLTP